MYAQTHKAKIMFHSMSLPLYKAHHQLNYKL